MDEDVAGVINEAMASILEPGADDAWRGALMVTLIEALEHHPLARRVVAGLEPQVTGRVIELPALAELRLAIANRLDTVILTDIPQLSPEKRNEAKRFVTLIDTLYEAKVKLICSAGARPEMLYIEGEGTFEFARTASRLREMQAADWGRTT